MLKTAFPYVHSKGKYPVRNTMRRLWPFKKKAAEPEGQKVVTYNRDDSHAEGVLSDRSHVEDDDYKAALDLLTKPHLGGEAGKEIISQTVIESDDDNEAEMDYQQGTDGYWYMKNSDGSFEPTAYIKGDDGSFAPYSA